MIKKITLNDIRDMIDKNNEDKKYCERVTKEIQEHGYLKSIPDAAFIQRMVAEDRHSPGMVIQYPHGTVMQQEKRSNYYRGESSLYGSSRPSIYRNSPKDLKEKLIYYFISEMRIYEFNQLISKFEVVKEWPWDVLYRAIAQHYGIPTNWMDITNDFETALFFACCKYDKGRYRPLNKFDFKEENDRYGVIFKADSFLADLKYGMFEGDGGIMPIGFQPFMRCHRQYGHAYVMEEDMDLYKSNDFQMMKFKHSIDLSKEIFEHMNRGEKIFPNEGLEDLENEISEIKETNTFSDQAYENVVKSFNFKGIDIDMKNELKGLGIYIGKSPIKISRQRIRKLDRGYRKIDFLKECPLPPHTRLVYKPPNKDELYISVKYKTDDKNK